MDINAAQLLVSIVSTGMQAIQLWHELRERTKVADLIKTVEIAKISTETVEEAQTLQILIPRDILNALADRVNQCWSKYKKIIESSDYLPQEIDEATEALKKCICRELRRIYELNKEIPSGILKRWWDAYECYTKY